MSDYAPSVASPTATTCGPLYARALKRWTDGDPEKVRLFAAGFVHGEAEKIHLGACHGAMFRPSEQYHKLMVECVRSAAEIYDLEIRSLPTSRGLEFWITDRLGSGILYEVRQTEENSVPWHRLRGELCGVAEIDERFHLRAGYGEQAD